MDRVDRILYIPSARKGNGTGHLKRCARWSSQLPVQNFYIPEGDESFSPEVIDRITSCCRNKRIIRKNPGSDWDLLILDNRKTEQSSLPEVLDGIPLLAIDESGPMRGTAPYLMDTLPGLPLKNQTVNRRGFSFLDLPDRGVNSQDSGARDYQKILVSFGGEDPLGLTKKILSGLKTRGTQGRQWFLVEGPSFAEPLMTEDGGRDVRLLTAPANLKDQLGKYDLVLCSFGLTAFEALSAGTDILIINPSSYHDRLSAKASMPCIQRGWKRSGGALWEAIKKNTQRKSLTKNNEILKKHYHSPREDFAQWIGQLTPCSNRCPVCGSRDNPVLYRYEHKSYCRCRSPFCGMVYMINFQEKKDLYGSAYFFEDYQNQYGKTYLQDFEHIKQNGFKRLDSIGKYHTEQKALLDIGCAFGPFLEAAKERGYSCYGVDISDAAIEHIRTHLSGIRAVSCPFEDFDPQKEFGQPRFDVITLWYVIEHFKNPSVLLEHICVFLEDGGILAFSTPNGRGTSGLMNPLDFFWKSPDDHFTLWDRKSARKILTNHGFSRIRFVVTGYHPERIPVKIPFRSLLNKTFLLWFCKLFRLGDTFEIYAMKKGNR